MGSKSEAVLNSRFPAVKRINIERLKGFIALMGPEDKELFEKAYGNLLRLLQLDVQESVIMALSRFYDPEIRCFLFKDFQLAPTLEEYEEILGFSRPKSAPYQYQKHRYTDQKFSQFLQISVRELVLHKEKKNRLTGFQLSYFGSLLTAHAQASKWGPFRQLLALIIFGIVLFPQFESFIDENAIGLFLAFISKDNPINPVPAILADTYYSYTHHRVLGKKRIVCSLHVLYAWLLNHVITHKNKATDLVDYALSCEVEARSAQEWVHALGNLNALKINWFTHSCWKDRPSILFQCGNFQNVPLMGTQGYINHNPSLTIRQLGYPMKNAPTQDMLTPVFLDKEDSKNQALFQKIAKAWENPVYKDKNEIAKKTSEISFYQWLCERMQGASITHQGALSVERGISEPDAPIDKALNEVKSTLSKVEEEKKALQDQLEKVMAEKKRLEGENKRKAEALEEANKRLKKEEESKEEVKKYLKGAKDELKRSNAKAGEAMAEANEWKKLCKKSLASEKAARKSLTESKPESHLVMELRRQMRNIEHERASMEGVLKEYQQALMYEREIAEEVKRDLRYIEEAYGQVRAESQHWHERFMALIGRIEDQEIIKDLREDIQFWKSKFSKLAWLANQAVKDLPKRLRKAEAKMSPFNTPVQVFDFVTFCKDLTNELMGQAREAAAVGKEKKGAEKLKAIGF